MTQFNAGLGIDNAVDFIVSCKMSDLSWLQMVVSHKKTLGFPGKLLSFSTSFSRQPLITSATTPL